MQIPNVFYLVLLSLIAISLVLAGCDDDERESSLDAPEESTTAETKDDADDNDELSAWNDWSCNEETAARVDEWLAEAHEWRDGGAQVALDTDSLPLADGPRLPVGADVNVTEFDGERLRIDDQWHSLMTLRDDPTILRNAVENSPLGVAIDGGVSSADALQLFQVFNTTDVLEQLFVLATPPRSEALRQPLDVLSDASESRQGPLEPREWAEGCEPLEALFDEADDDFEVLANSLTKGWMKCDCEPALKTFVTRNVANVVTTDAERVVTYTDLTLTDDGDIALHAADDTDHGLRTVAIRDADVLAWSDIVPRQIRPSRAAPQPAVGIADLDIADVFDQPASDGPLSNTDVDDPHSGRRATDNDLSIDDIDDDVIGVPPEKGELSPTMIVSLEGVDEDATFTRAFRRLDRNVEACFQAELVMNRDARGAIRLEVKLKDERGWRLARPKIIKDEVGGDVGRCIANELPDNRMPVPDDEESPPSITVTYVFYPS